MNQPNDEFPVSRPDADATELQDRMREDGYLFFRGLLDPDRVLDVRRHILNAVAPMGWLAEDSDPFEGIPGTPRTFDDDEWWPGYVAIQSVEQFHSLAHEPALKDLIAKLVDSEVLAHPAKIARLNYPGTYYPTHPHQDYVFIHGHTDVFTAWIPLGHVNRELGGLKVLPGSHHEGLRAYEHAKGAGNATADVDPDDSRFRTTDYEPGDVIVFHSLVVHQGPNNRGERVRLSCDFRYQSVDTTVSVHSFSPSGWGNGKIPHWHKLAKDWTSTEWVDPPPVVRLSTLSGDLGPLYQSRFAKIPTG